MNFSRLTFLIFAIPNLLLNNWLIAEWLRRRSIVWTNLYHNNITQHKYWKQVKLTQVKIPLKYKILFEHHISHTSLDVKTKGECFGFYAERGVRNMVFEQNFWFWEGFFFTWVNLTCFQYFFLWYIFVHVIPIWNCLNPFSYHLVSLLTGLIG